MKHRVSIVALAVPVLASLLATAVPATADPVRLQSGFLALRSDPQLSFGVDLGFFEAPDSSTLGFTAVGEAPVLRDYLAGFPCRGCDPRTQPAIFRLQFEPTEVIDPSTNSSCPGCGYRADLVFNLGAAEAGESRFTMTGTLIGFLNRGTGDRALNATVHGQGTYRATFDEVLFRFASDPVPVPEPATLLLLGSGLAGIAATRRRRARRPL